MAFHSAAQLPGSAANTSGANLKSGLHCGCALVAINHSEEFAHASGFGDSSQMRFHNGLQCASKIKHDISFCFPCGNSVAIHLVAVTLNPMRQVSWAPRSSMRRNSLSISGTVSSDCSIADPWEDIPLQACHDIFCVYRTPGPTFTRVPLPRNYLKSVLGMSKPSGALGLFVLAGVYLLSEQGSSTVSCSLAALRADGGVGAQREAFLLPAESVLESPKLTASEVTSRYSPFVIEPASFFVERLAFWT